MPWDVVNGRTWLMVATAHHVLYYQPSFDRKTLSLLYRHVDNLYAFLASRMPLRCPSPMRVFLVPGDTGRPRCHWASGSVRVNADLDFPALLERILHQETHLFEFTYAGRYGHSRSLGWPECVYFEERAGMAGRGVDPREEILRVMPEGPACSLGHIELLGTAAWDESFAAMFFLEQQYGADRLAHFLGERLRIIGIPGRADPVTPLLRVAFGKDLEELDREWREFYGWPQGPGHLALATARDLDARAGPERAEGARLLTADSIAECFQCAGFDVSDRAARYRRLGMKLAEALNVAGVMESEVAAEEFVLLLATYGSEEGKDNAASVGLLAAVARELHKWQNLPASVMVAALCGGAEWCADSGALKTYPPVPLEKVRVAICVGTDPASRGITLSMDETQSGFDWGVLEQLALEMGVPTRGPAADSVDALVKAMRGAGVPTVSLRLGQDFAGPFEPGEQSDQQAELDRVSRLLTLFMLTLRDDEPAEAEQAPSEPEPVQDAWQRLGRKVAYSAPFATVGQVAEAIAAQVGVPHNRQLSSMSAGRALSGTERNVSIRGQTGHEALSELLKKHDLLYSIRDGQLVINADPNPAVHARRVVVRRQPRPRFNAMRSFKPLSAANIRRRSTYATASAGAAGRTGSVGGGSGGGGSRRTSSFGGSGG
jgi:hypothetical protein